MESGACDTEIVGILDAFPIWLAKWLEIPHEDSGLESLLLSVPASVDFLRADPWITPDPGSCVFPDLAVSSSPGEFRTVMQASQVTARSAD